MPVTIRNTGAAPLTNIALSLPGANNASIPAACTPAGLAGVTLPAGGAITCSNVTYTITRDDLDAGYSKLLTGQVSAKYLVDSVSGTGNTTVSLAGNKGMQFTKQVLNGTYAEPGE